MLLPVWTQSQMVIRSCWSSFGNSPCVRCLPDEEKTCPVWLLNILWKGHRLIKLSLVVVRACFCWFRPLAVSGFCPGCTCWPPLENSWKHCRGLYTGLVKPPETSAVLSPGLLLQLLGSEIEVPYKGQGFMSHWSMEMGKALISTRNKSTFQMLFCTTTKNNTRFLQSHRPDCVNTSAV